jgi:hypothetical protein
MLSHQKGITGNSQLRYPKYVQQPRWYGRRTKGKHQISLEKILRI